ncbi:MAG: hypothetical protein BWZ10_01558 [candidate division BRC1 bacterium ADurb.BinA364]|nr:MAG: hypothetical protein BWZ10_01558 [candidate division BRC1 bacterium ADurb.BinA364]
MIAELMGNDFPCESIRHSQFVAPLLIRVCRDRRQRKPPAVAGHRIQANRNPHAGNRLQIRRENRPRNCQRSRRDFGGGGKIGVRIVGCQVVERPRSGIEIVSRLVRFDDARESRGEIKNIVARRAGERMPIAGRAAGPDSLRRNARFFDRVASKSLDRSRNGECFGSSGCRPSRHEDKRHKRAGRQSQH